MKRSTIANLAIGAGVAGAAIVLLQALVFEKYNFEVKLYDIGKKESTKKLKLLLLTDLHFKKRLWNYYRKLARTINHLQPDLVLIAGDIFDETGRAKTAIRFFDLLHPIPKVAVLGNHDHRSNISTEIIKEIFDSYEGDLLINESKAYTINNSRLMITGLDDFIEGQTNFEKAISGIGAEANHILLIHSPLLQERVQAQLKNINAQRNADEQLNISYIFAGHNHGGQVKLLGYAPVLPKKSGSYISGWYNKKKPYLYVSKGFGTTTIPVRLGARAEVILFNYYV